MKLFITSLLSLSAFALAGCQSGIINHTTHAERVIKAQKATQFLEKRYQQLKIEENTVANFKCPQLNRADKKAEKIIEHLKENSRHPRAGQSAFHVPTALNLKNAERTLDRLSTEIEKCQASPHLKHTAFKADK
ncbi:hypothetical protein FAI40_02595 [Acetobacteraceae bacterium]|nr:hypothetical protein FAI40_02595 [Acetobacteraceae bacterium]